MLTVVLTFTRAHGSTHTDEHLTTIPRCAGGTGVHRFKNTGVRTSPDEVLRSRPSRAAGAGAPLGARGDPAGDAVETPKTRARYESVMGLSHLSNTHFLNRGFLNRGDHLVVSEEKDPR